MYVNNSNKHSFKLLHLNLADLEFRDYILLELEKKSSGLYREENISTLFLGFMISAILYKHKAKLRRAALLDKFIQSFRQY